MEGISVTVDMVRSALQSFCSGGGQVTTKQLMAALGLECEAEKARLRRRLSDMVHHGELKRIDEGVFEYNFSHRPRNPQSFSKIWRFVRHAKPWWSFSTAALMTHLSYTQVSRYCAWLEEEDYICRAGRDGQTILYQATRKADAHPEAPYPPLRDVDPFAREKAAAARIVQLLLCHDPYSRKVGVSVTEACRTLLSRFEKNVIQNENEPEGESHVQR